MALLVAEALILGVTVLLSCSTVTCVAHKSPQAPSSAPEYLYSLLHADNVVVDAKNREAFRFEKASGSVVSNLYRLYGSLVSDSSRKVATFYRSVVGKGGVLEFDQPPPADPGLSLPMIFARWRKKPVPKDPPMRVVILAKLDTKNFELDTGDPEKKFLWCPGDGMLFCGASRNLAAVIDRQASESRLSVDSTFISPELAVCLFFI